MSEYELTSVDARIGKILDMVSDKVVTKSKHLFCEKYSQKRADEIDWIELCDNVNELKCYKFACLFLSELLVNSLYVGSYKDTLYNLSKEIEQIADTVLYSKIFCNEKIEELIFFKSKNNKDRRSYAFVEKHNSEIRKELLGLLNSEGVNTAWVSMDFLYHFEASFSQYCETITSYKSFNGNTMFAQIGYYKNLYKDDSKAYKFAVKGVVYFYRYLVSTYTEYDFFENSFNMNQVLLFSRSLYRFIEEDYYFTTFNPYNDISTKTKVCFLLKEVENISTSLTKEDWTTVNLSCIEDVTYRKFIWNFILSSSSSVMLAISCQLTYVVQVLGFILNMKSTPDYPNKNKYYLTNQEALLIREYINKNFNSLYTKNNYIGAVRRFFVYAKENELLSFDDMFFDYLRQYEEPVKGISVNSVPDDKLILMNAELLKKAKEGLLGKIVYTIFHLALQTEFRINQICHLKIDCIKPSIKPGQYIISTNSKTSHGAVKSFVITDTTYKMLIDIIEDTEEIREQCNVDPLTNYIFLFNSSHDGILLFKDYMFTAYLKKICTELGFEECYSASNLRDTHMTKAFEHILRSGKSDTEMSVLSSHRHIDTTKNHYIDTKLEEMLEATYGIVIGEEYIKADTQIVENIPAAFDTKENDVEHGCGKCSSESCDLKSSLPCLACKHFITTVRHEVYFKKAIERIDKLISKTSNKHDKEDLVTIKKLYILYLKAIYKYKEEHSND